MEWIKKYWWVLLIGAVAITAPLVINWVILQPQKFEIIGDGTHWLSFWGTYIGTIFSSSVALFILWRTLIQNHRENEQNRIENEKTNNANRELQLNILEYQQQMQWLTTIKTVAIDYVSVYNINDIIEIQNLMTKDVIAAHNKTKELLYRLSKVHLALLMMLTEQDCCKCNKENCTPCRFCGFINLQDDNTEKLTDLIMDTQQLVCLLMTNKNPNTTAKVIEELKTNMYTSDIMKEYINDVIETNPLVKEINRLLDKRIWSMPAISFTQIDTQVRSFIGKEQERINKILTR